MLSVDLERYVVAALGLGQGELEAMALYRAVAADRLLVDDRRARRVARLNGMHVIGSLGVLVQAKASGLIPALEPRITAMSASGIHMSERVVQDALRLAGE